jgi:hypothetical protein
MKGARSPSRLNNKTFVDNFRTPHTERLHVVERWRVIDAGCWK